MILLRKTIAFDQDQVLANLNKKWLACYNEDYNDNLTIEDLKYWDMTKNVKPECGARIFEYLHKHKFYRDLEVMEGAIEAVEKLSHKYDIAVATDAMFSRMSFKSKYDWILEHFSCISSRNIMLIGSKKYVWADFLVDDNPENLYDYMGNKPYGYAHGVLFDAPYNQENVYFPRMHNFDEILDYFL
jgi:5'(3')-deoxyribonucleotidase